jgi:hypothetical protein
MMFALESMSTWNITVRPPERAVIDGSTYRLPSKAPGNNKANIHTDMYI